jgi:hypothetical protein
LVPQIEAPVANSGVAESPACPSKIARMSSTAETQAI